LPDVPTVAESGLKDFAVATWFGLLGPARKVRAPGCGVSNLRRSRSDWRFQQFLQRGGNCIPVACSGRRGLARPHQPEAYPCRNAP